jgi:hypothetical protein
LRYGFTLERFNFNLFDSQGREAVAFDDAAELFRGALRQVGVGQHFVEPEQRFDTLTASA